MKDVKYADLTLCHILNLESMEIKWKVRQTNITCHSRNIFYHLKCKLCMYETYIGKTINDHIHGFKTTMNNNITEKGAYRVNSPFTFLTAVK